VGRRGAQKVRALWGGQARVPRGTCVCVSRVLSLKRPLGACLAWLVSLRGAPPQGVVCKAPLIYGRSGGSAPSGISIHGSVDMKAGAPPTTVSELCWISYLNAPFVAVGKVVAATWGLMGRGRDINQVSVATGQERFPGVAQLRCASRPRE